LIQRSIPKNVGSWSRAFREKCLFAELNGAFKLKFIDANHGYGIFGNWKGDGVPEGTCIIADGKLVSVEETKGKLEGNILKWKRTANMVLLEHTDRVINDNPPDKKDRIETVWIAKRTASPCREYYEKEPIQIVRGNDRTFVISKKMIFIGSDDLTKCVHSGGWVNHARGSKNSVSNATLVCHSDEANPFDSFAYWKLTKDIKFGEEIVGEAHGGGVVYREEGEGEGEEGEREEGEGGERERDEGGAGEAV
jgi:hypothetical protein